MLWCRPCQGLAIVTFLWVLPTAYGEAEGRSTPRLLLDLARDRGLLIAGRQSPADVLYIQSLLRAAVRLDPRQTEAHVLLYELAVLSDDGEQARYHLEQIVRSDSRNTTAYAAWLNAALQEQQTTEKRIDWLTRHLAESGVAGPSAAIAHLALAELSVQRVDPTAVRLALDRVLGADPYNPDARWLRFQILDQTVPVPIRIQAGLQALEANPLDVGTAWTVGSMIHDSGMPQEAAMFWEHALEVHRRMNPGETPPGSFELALARNAYARGRVDEAVRQATAVFEGPPAARLEAGVFLQWLARKHRLTITEGVLDELEKQSAAVRDPDEWPVAQVAWTAWYHCTVRTAPQRALSLAQNAVARAPDDPIARRVLGWALAVNSRYAEAIETLRPLAARDPAAAVLLAQLLRREGDEPGSAAVVDALTVVPNAGPIHDLFLQAGLPLPEGDPAEIRSIRGLLNSFERSCLNFHEAPARFLEVELIPENRSPSPGQPWWLTISLKNKGRFPIALGPERLVNPTLVLSVEVEADRKRQFPNLLILHLDQARTIPPGETRTLRTTIDVGPLRQLSRAMPQHLLRVVVNGIFDPVPTSDDGWEPSATGQTIRPAYMNRLPTQVTSQHLRALLASSGSDAPRVGARALEEIAELLGEQQRAALDRLSYEVQTVPAEPLAQRLRAALESRSWELRVHALEALQVVGLDEQMFAATEKCLEHEHWLVRLMAIRVLQRQGSAFIAHLEELARTDSDAIVRDVARSILQKHQELHPTTTAPAGDSER